MPMITRRRSGALWSSQAALVSAIMIAAAGGLAACGEPAAESGPVDCSYPSSGDRARLAKKPASLDVPSTGEVPLQLRTTAGNIDIILSRDGAPCAVNSFDSLVSQAFFVQTRCHRLTTPPASIAILQCGDPTGTGAGGPGYVVPDEPPVGLDEAEPDARGITAVVYPRGTIALANRGVADSGGSQFFLVYQDSVLPPEFSVLGAVEQASLPVLDAIADAGSDDNAGPGDGMPATPVTVTAVDRRD